MREEGRGKRKGGSGKAILWLVLAAIALVVGVLVFAAGRRVPSPPQPASSEPAADSGLRRSGTERPAGGTAAVERGISAAPQSQNEEASSTDNSTEIEEPKTEEEKREAEEGRLVNAFDDLTDKWMEPSKTGVTMADVDDFAKQFRQVPKARQDECIHRALNLIPDENVMLLAGVLMDKSIDKEIVETVYKDILNRSEDVKKPILQEIFKDKTHPCWVDTAWILDVTGELPKKK